VKERERVRKRETLKVKEERNKVKKERNRKKG
jgi:hypothetical protein